MTPLRAELDQAAQMVSDGRHALALARLDSLLSHHPDHPRGHMLRGWAQLKLRNFEAALKDFDQALARRPQMFLASFHRAVVLFNLERFEDAGSEFERATALNGTSADARLQLGRTYKELSRFDEARDCFLAALRLAPRPSARSELARLELLRGDLAQGLRRMERWRGKPGFSGEGATPLPPIGEIAGGLAGKTVLLLGERGLGDTLQFVRYGADLQALGARVLIAPQPELVETLRDLTFEAEILSVEEATQREGIDYYAPIMSLPHLFGTDAGAIPAPLAYLRAREDRSRAWAARLGPAGFRIGVCWQGGLHGGDDLGRSFPLAELSAIAGAPGVRLVSLQKGEGLSQLGSLPPGMAVETLGAEGPESFVDTAAVMAHCDLVISSDTSVLHLSGALGRPTWAALRHVADWRWGVKGEDCPWYPSMRLFRQGVRGDWSGVFAAMRGQLSQSA